MRPFVVLLGIVMGSTVSTAVALLLTGLVFLLIPGSNQRLADEHGPLGMACLLSVLLAAIASTSFYAELRRRTWRLAAHAGLAVMVAIALWSYWPRS